MRELRAQVKQTAHYQAEKDRLAQEYQRSQVRFRTVFEESAVGKKIINDQLQIIKVNKALLQIVGYAENEMLGRRILEFAHPEFVAHWKHLQHELWTTELPSFNFDTCLIRKDGSTVWVHVTTILIDDNGGRLGYTILEDISARMEIERLRHLVREQEQRQQIAEIILNTQEDERRRVGESLHNGLGQLLYGVKLSLSAIEAQIHDPDSLRYTQQLLTQSIQECRRISHDLMPAVLAESGLRAAVKDICRQMTGDTVFKCEITAFTERIAPAVEAAIYRIIQELLMNIVKHAKASLATLVLDMDETEVHIRVSDNGKGFDAGHFTGGIGLQTIAYKVRLLTGSFSITSEPGKGTSVRISVPKRVD